MRWRGHLEFFNPIQMFDVEVGVVVLCCVVLCCDEGSEGGEKGVKEVGEEIWKRTRRVFLYAFSR